jgi:hypothetical protein
MARMEAARMKADEKYILIFKFESKETADWK